MPYAPGFERALQARAHGWMPKKRKGSKMRESMQRISPKKAEAMVSEAKAEGQRRALR